MNEEKLNTRHLQIISYCAIALTLFIATFCISKLQAVLVPLTIAVIFYILLLPLVSFFWKTMKLPKWLSIALTLAVGMATFFGLLSTLIYSIQKFSDRFKFYQVRLREEVGNSMFSPLLYRDAFENFDFSEIFNFAQQLSNQAFSISGYFVLTSIFLFFLMATKYKSSDQPSLFSNIQTHITTYIWIKSLVSMATAFCVGLVYFSVNIELAFMFTFITLVLNFIPSIGSIIAALLPLPLAYLQFGLGIEFTMVLVLPASVHIIIGNIIEPKLMGDNFGIHPIAVLFFLIFWGIVWGPVGMFLAVPLTSIFKILFSHIPELKCISDILGGDIRSLSTLVSPVDTTKEEP